MSRGPGANDVLYMWTIYKHPLDYPESFVLRRFAIMPGNPEPVGDPEPLCIAPSLQQAREFLPPFLTCLPRQPGDHPTVVETWL